MSRTEPWATVADVQREFGVARTKATELIRIHLGGFKPAGLDAWRCTWKSIRDYKRKQEGTAAKWTNDFPSSPEKPRAEPIGTATSAHLTIADSNALSTSETTGAQNQERLQSLPSGTSKHAQRMASLIAKHARAARSEKRSRRSPENKTSQD